MRKFVLRSAAATDLRQAYHWYEREREGLGDELLREVRVAIDAVLERPHLYPVIHRDTRRVLVHRFPYGLLYRLVGETVVFVACYHTSRDPEGWKRRR